MTPTTAPSARDRRLPLGLAAGVAGAVVLALGVAAAAGPVVGLVTGVAGALLVAHVAGNASGRALVDARARLAHAEDLLARARDELGKTQHLATFGTLGAGITHEAKNPVTALIGFAQLAQKRIDDRDKVLELLRIIETESLRCRDILTSYLEFARGGRAEREPLDVDALVEATARITRHQLVVHGVDLEVALGERVPPVVGSAGELQQVLVNLVLNAQQALNGRGVVRLTTSAAADGRARVTVADDGPGVPPELRERIFEPFFTTKARGEGTGLGLAISADIARAHGGELRLEPDVARGAAFTLSLPAAPPGTVVAAPSRRASGSVRPAPPAAARGKRKARRDSKH